MKLLNFFKREEITIEVDGLPVPVDKAEYEANPEAVVGSVRAKRDEQTTHLETIEPAPDYDALVAEYGEGDIV